MADFPIYAHSAVPEGDFPGADADPITGNFTSYPGFPQTARRISNQLGGNNDFWSSLYKINSAEGIFRDLEVIFDMPAFDETTKAFDFRVRAFGTAGAPLTLTNRNEYGIYAASGGEMLISRFVNNVETNLLTTAAGSNPFVDGDQVGLAARGVYVALWRKPAAGSWTEVAAVTDTNAARLMSGWFGIGAASNVFRYDNVTVGVPVRSPNYLFIPKPKLRREAVVA